MWIVQVETVVDRLQDPEVWEMITHVTVINGSVSLE